MGVILATSNFRTFFLAAAEEAGNVEDYMDKLKTNFHDVARDMHLGYMELSVNSPSTALILNELKYKYNLYTNENGYKSDAGVRETFVTNDFGIIQLEAYPEEGYNWTPEELDELEFLFNVIYECVSKNRLQLLMRQAVITDSLTGACNQTGLLQAIDKYYSEGKLDKYTVLYFNIKNFSYINHRFGPNTGDTVLKDYCFMIRSNMVPGEVFARMGGDNFCLLTENDRAEDTIRYIESRKTLVELDNKDTIEVDLAARIGVFKIEKSDNPSRIVPCVLAAYSLTRNPSTGNVVWFKEEMLQTSEHDKEISQKFKKGIKGREFVVFYQPKVDINSRSLCAAEALCRWMWNDVVVMPGEFIPVLEREGTICELDFYMLNMVCENISEWLSRGIEPVKIAVNFSRAHILNKKLANKISKVIESHNVDTKYIEIEITEMSGYEDFETISDFVNTMKENGIETSIDDFGTGYSSLNLIKDLNVDKIKLDRSFLEKIDSDSDEVDKSVVKNIVNMVNELNMKVIAEGVETNSQMEFLKGINCHEAQGYLFDKPLPKTEFEFRLLGERLY